MENIGQLFNSALAPAREHKKELNKKMWCPEFARFKLQFINRNGTTSIPYPSFDTHKGVGGKNITDEEVGYSKLIVLSDKRRIEDVYVSATIWANLTDDLRFFISGKLNKNYDHIVFKHVRGQKPFVSPWLKFRDGRMDVQFFMRGIGGERVA